MCKETSDNAQVSDALLTYHKVFQKGKKYPTKFCFIEIIILNFFVVSYK